MIDAVVMAGGHMSCDPSRFVMPRAAYPLGGVPMVCRVVRALAEAPSVGRIYVVGHPRLREVLAGEQVTFAEGRERLLDALRIAADLPQAGRPFLLAAADMPLLTAEAVEVFLDAGRQSGCAVGYPIVARSVIEAACPGARRTYVHLADGVFTGGNLFWLGGGAAADKLLAFAERIYARRKQPWRLAALFGWGLCLWFLLRRVTSEEAALRISRIVGADCRALVMPYAEIAMDADREDDLKIIEKFLR